MLQATGAEHLTGVPASTHTPLLVSESRSRLLNDGWHREVPWCPIRICREDIDLPDHIAMSAETTLSAGIDPAAWFMPIPAVRAGLTGVVLILQHHTYPFGLRFVRNIGADVAMAPSADF